MEEKYLAAEEELAQVREESEKLDDKVAELEEEMEAAGAKVRNLLQFFQECIYGLRRY